MPTGRDKYSKKSPECLYAQAGAAHTLLRDGSFALILFKYWLEEE